VLHHYRNLGHLSAAWSIKANQSGVACLISPCFCAILFFNKPCILLGTIISAGSILLGTIISAGRVHGFIG